MWKGCLLSHEQQDYYSFFFFDKMDNCNLFLKMFLCTLINIYFKSIKAKILWPYN